MRLFRIAVVPLCISYLSACAATGPATVAEDQCVRLDCEKMAQVSRLARERGLDVIWINPYRPGTPDNLHPGMGIRFVSIDNELRDRLLELIRRFAYLS